MTLTIIFILIFHNNTINNDNIIKLTIVTMHKL